MLNYAENDEGYRTDISAAAYTDVFLNNLDSVHVFLWYSADRFDDRNSFDNGTFAIDAVPSLELSYETDEARKVSVKGGVELAGEDLGGHSAKFNLGLAWRPDGSGADFGDYGIIKRDYGLTAGLDFGLPLARGDEFVIDVRYDFGVLDVSTGSGGGRTWSALLVLAGIRFGEG